MVQDQLGLEGRCAEAEREQRVLMLERTGYEVGKQEDPPKVMKGERDKAGANTSHFSIHTCEMIDGPHLCICHKLGGISHRSVCFALRSNALGRYDDTVPWSGAERRMDRRTGSLWAAGHCRPCSSCCSSRNAPWSFLRNT